MAFLSGYTNRKKITISNTNVISDLTNFPVMVKFTSDADIGGLARSDGYDIRFTSSDGATLLNYERELFSISSGNASGTFWVCVPTVASASPTDIYIYFGKADASSDTSTRTFWDGDYSNIYHFGEYGDGLNDSSANGNHLTNNGLTISDGKVTCSGDDYGIANFQSNISTTTNRMLSGVARTTGGSSRRCIMSFALHNNDFEAQIGHTYIASSNWLLGVEAGKAGVYAMSAESDVTITSDDIYHIAAAYKDNGEVDLYVNGVYKTTYVYEAVIAGTNKVWNWTHPAVQAGDPGADPPVAEDSVTFDFNGTQATYNFFSGDITTTFNTLFGSGNWSMTGSVDVGGSNYNIELIGALAKTAAATPTIYSEVMLSGNNSTSEVTAGLAPATELSAPGDELLIGSQFYEGSPYYGFVGDIYEARYSLTIRSPAWIKFEAKNLLNGETTFDTLESSGGGSVTTLFAQKRILICA
jgi:hypothetical protein